MNARQRRKETRRLVRVAATYGVRFNPWASLAGMQLEVRRLKRWPSWAPVREVAA